STTDKHEFRENIPPDLPRVAADREKLVQILANLLDNAIKYSPDGGTITVSATHEPGRDRVVVAVEDHGIGIASEDQDRVFTAFQRIRRPETRGIGGTGLGLYIVKALAELSQGEVWLESQVQWGSTFFFSLPTTYAVEDAERQVAMEGSGHGHKSATGG
ncbi:MAG: sensor histidine kinase, partial [Dehalococcoidia bacterium]